MSVSHPVARTAFYCCVLRADDAAQAAPVCGDTYAARFVDDTVRRDLAPVLRFVPPARSNVARHRIVDDIVRESLAADRNRRVILAGAGFDTRAFRLDGGRWFELDDPQLLAFKESRLPIAEATNPIERIAVAFDTTPPDRFLAPLAGDDEALVILEGVSMYLSDSQLTEFATALGRHLPNATLVCDLMSPFFLRTFSRSLRAALSDLGAVFGERHVHPRVSLEHGGWHVVRHVSIPGRASELGSMQIPRWLLATFLRPLREGYQIYVLQHGRG